MLAILRLPAGEPAGDALRALGVTDEALAEAIAALPSEYSAREHVSRSPGPGRVVAPEGMMFLGRAEGIAAGLGSSRVLPEHLLLSVLWENVRSVTEELLEHLGASRDRIHNKLVEFGVRVPPVPLPRRLQWTEFRVVSQGEFERTRTDLDRAGTPYRVAHRGNELLLSVSKGVGPTPI